MRQCLYLEMLVAMCLPQLASRPTTAGAEYETINFKMIIIIYMNIVADYSDCDTITVDITCVCTIL